MDRIVVKMGNLLDGIKIFLVRKMIFPERKIDIIVV